LGREIEFDDRPGLDLSSIRSIGSNYVLVIPEILRERGRVKAGSIQVGVNAAIVSVKAVLQYFGYILSINNEDK
jgi:hypothetical protein